MHAWDRMMGFRFVSPGRPAARLSVRPSIYLPRARRACAAPAHGSSSSSLPGRGLPGRRVTPRIATAGLLAAALRARRHPVGPSTLGVGSGARRSGNEPGSAAGDCGRRLGRPSRPARRVWRADERAIHVSAVGRAYRATAGTRRFSAGPSAVVRTGARQPPSTACRRGAGCHIGRGTTQISRTTCAYAP
jgi:hypothetical protein